MDVNLGDCYVAVESRDALEERDLRVWGHTSFLFGTSYHTLKTVSYQGSPRRRLLTESPDRKRASIPDPERMARAAPAFGLTSSAKRTLDLVTDHPMIPREHLAHWLGVSDGRVSQMMHNLVDTWGLVERRGKRGGTRYTLSAEGIRYIPTGTAPSSPRPRASGAQPSRQTARAADDTSATASTRGHGRRSTRTASRGSSRSWRPRPGPIPAAICCGRSLPRGRTAPTTGAGRPSPRTPWASLSQRTSTSRSTPSTSFALATPGESWPA